MDAHTLPSQALARLEQAFKPREHGFMAGVPYLKKDAIRRRLTLVDPRWSISAPQLVTISHDVVIMTASLTVCGVTRSALGSGIIVTTKKSGAGQVELTGYDLSRSAAKAFKTAASDTLPRCFAMFGGGDYLRLIPGDVRDEQALARWLTRYEAELLGA